MEQLYGDTPTKNDEHILIAKHGLNIFSYFTNTQYRWEQKNLYMKRTSENSAPSSGNKDLIKGV